MPGSQPAQPGSQDAAGRWALVDPGVWIELRTAPRPAPTPALFLDRDGVIVEDIGFLADPASVKLVSGAATLIATVNQAGIPVLSVTNQSGIDRGRYGWTEFAAVEAEISGRLIDQGAHLDGVAACPFHPDFTPGYGPEQANWRKPGAGMLTALAERLNLDLARSWLVGDRSRDLEAARAAGLAGAVHLLAGKGSAESENMRPHAGADFLVTTVTVLADAALFLSEVGLIDA